MTLHFTPGVLMALLLVPVTVAAQDDPRPRKELRGQLGASINNAGLQNTTDLTWTRPLSRSSHPLLKDAHLTTGVTHAITPAQMRAGGWLEVAPLSVFSVRFGAEPAVYFGTFNSLQSFQAYDEPFDKEARDARGGAAAGGGMRVYASPTVRLKVGPVVGASTVDLEWWRSTASGPLFYEPTRDTLLAVSGDGLLAMTNVVMYQRDVQSGFISGGLIHSRMSVRDSPANGVQKVGAIVVREFAGRRAWLPQPRFTLVVAKYVDDPSKKGQWTAAFAVGFRK